MGVSAFVITNGAKDITAFSDGRIFKPLELVSLPVSAKVDRELQENPESKGDTTGCGDNFAGGVLASVASQLASKGSGGMDLVEACGWGAASGGFACFYVGGTYLEKEPGEKHARVSEYFTEYAEQIADIHKINHCL
jgi:sugar/nucleoside kinase (ribokinase family)